MTGRNNVLKQEDFTCVTIKNQLTILIRNDNIFQIKRLGDAIPKKQYSVNLVRK